MEQHMVQHRTPVVLCTTTYDLYAMHTNSRLDSNNRHGAYHSGNVSVVHGNASSSYILPLLAS